MDSVPGEKFEPVDLSTSPHPDSGLPPEIWTIIQSAPAAFPPEFFLEVSRNLLENPNLTASHLSRAEISYQSFADPTFNPLAEHPHDLAKIIKHLKADHQPRILPGGIPGYRLEWTVVRKLIPRNPKLDAALLQTSHLFQSTQDVETHAANGEAKKRVAAERYMVVYIPHADAPENIPFYHPKVSALAILYTFLASHSPSTPPGTLSLHYSLFPCRPLDNRLSRTALRMLEIIHKHSKGRQAGYKKRVHHDVVIAQKPFQDTYAYLKGKYAQELVKGWVEQTPAEKHVFEDLGIAAFLVELWKDMYAGGIQARREGDGPNAGADVTADGEEAGPDRDQRTTAAQQNFPGFVDLGCGNGLLVWILNEEGWSGWGFDARARKTWSTFPDRFRAGKLKERLLVPEVLRACQTDATSPQTSSGPEIQNGIFPPGTFIVANHADELTVWTPPLAYLSDSPFVAIPCCSHHFGGRRFRAPARLLQDEQRNGKQREKAAKNGKQPSAYASFCGYTAHLAREMGYVAEKEHLRIPSTRNVAILGRRRAENARRHEKQSLEEKLEFIRGTVEKEIGLSISAVRDMWMERSAGLMKPGKGGGH